MVKPESKCVGYLRIDTCCGVLFKLKSLVKPFKVCRYTLDQAVDWTGNPIKRERVRAEPQLLYEECALASPA